MVFTTADIIVIALILIFAFSGLIKGFVRTVISFCKGALSLLIAYFLAPHCATFLSGTGIYNVINKFLLGWTANKGPLFNEPIPEGGISEVIGEQLNLPNFIIEFLNNLIGNNETVQGVTLGEFIANSLTNYVLLIISFFVLSILARILISIIARWLTKLLEEESALRFINRLLGFTVGILKGLLIVLVVFWVMRFLSSWIGGIENLVNNYIAPDNPEFGIARWIYNNNFIDFIFDRLLNKESIELVGK